MNDCFLSVVIPAYNEQNRIINSLEKIFAYFSDKNFIYELIIVDDGSIDKTRSVINDYKSSIKNLYNCKKIELIALNENMGKGFNKDVS